MTIEIMKTMPVYEETGDKLIWFNDERDSDILSACLWHAGINPMTFDGKDWMGESHMRLDLNELKTAIKRLKDFSNQDEQFKKGVGKYFDENEFKEIAKELEEYDGETYSVPTLEDFIETLEEFLGYEVYDSRVIIEMYY